MRLQLDRACLFVCCILRVEKCLERRFRIDDDLFAAGKVDDEIGPEAAVVALQGRLFIEIATPQHPCDFHDAPQLHLAPPAAAATPIRTTMGTGTKCNRCDRSVSRCPCPTRKSVEFAGEFARCLTVRRLQSAHPWSDEPCRGNRTH